MIYYNGKEDQKEFIKKDQYKAGVRFYELSTWQKKLLAEPTKRRKVLA